jgi:transcriptional regulator with XRE-family HTH domain
MPAYQRDGRSRAINSTLYFTNLVEHGEMVMAASQKRLNPIDVEVGRRIRMYRLNAELSQGSLGDKIGVTFQQVQKYEKGVNRVGASRLTQIANAVKVSVSAFFEPTKGHQDDPVVELLGVHNALRLLKAYIRVRDPKRRRAIVSLVEEMADGH